MGNDIARQFAHLPHDAAVVAIAEHLARYYREHGSYTVGVAHRDIDRPPRG